MAMCMGILDDRLRSPSISGTGCRNPDADCKRTAPVEDPPNADRAQLSGRLALHC